MIPYFLNVSYCFLLIDNEMIPHFYTLVIASYLLISVTYSNTHHNVQLLLSKRVNVHNGNLFGVRKNLKFHVF